MGQGRRASRSTPNPKYWGTKPKLDKVIFKFLTDTAAEFQAFKSGEVSAIYPQPAARRRSHAIKARARRRQQPSYTADTGNVEALWMNNAKFPFDSVAVRQAIGYSIDRDAIVNRLFGDLGVNKAVRLAEPADRRRRTRHERLLELHARPVQGRPAS